MDPSTVGLLQTKRTALAKRWSGAAEEMSVNFQRNAWYVCAQPNEVVRQAVRRAILDKLVLLAGDRAR